MTDPARPAPTGSPSDQALHWFTKVRLGTLTPAEQRQFLHWRDAHPDHRRAYESLEALWQLTDHLPRDTVRAILDQTPEPATANPWRRRLLIGACAGAAALTVGVAGNYLSRSPVLLSRQSSTERGQRQRLSLPDGSVIDLNTASQVQVTFREDCRMARLDAGEALFSVAHDPSRPFVVEAGEATVRVTGTRFNVRRDAESVRVAVLAGSVEMATGYWWRRQQESLGAGQIARLTPQGELTAPRPGDVQAIAAWQRGRLEFRDAPLSRVAAELSRYLPHPVRVADAALGELRVSGTLGIDAPEAALELLPMIAPVAVIRALDGRATLIRH